MFKYSEKGFTIVEILVVIAIITILPAIVIANFPAIKLQFALSRAVHVFAQDVRKAQDLALSSATYQDAQGQAQLVSGYGIYLDVAGLGNKKYLIYADNNDNNASNHQYDVTDYIVSSLDFSSTESGIVIKEINNVFDNKASINFEPPHPTTTINTLTVGQTNVEVVFAIESDLSKTKTVSINISGLIQVQ